MTQEEYQKVLETMFESQEPLRLRQFSTKLKKRLAILRRISDEFQLDHTYTEKEVTAILYEIYDDPVLLRRELIDAGFLARTRDGRAYWKVIREEPATQPSLESTAAQPLEPPE